MLCIFWTDLEQLPILGRQEFCQTLHAIVSMRIVDHVALVVVGRRQAEEHQAARLDHAVHLPHGFDVTVRVERIAVSAHARVLDGREARGVIELLNAIFLCCLVEKVEYVLPFELAIAFVFVSHSGVVERGDLRHVEFDTDRLDPRHNCAHDHERLIAKLGLLFGHELWEHDVAIHAIVGHVFNRVEIVQKDLHHLVLDFAHNLRAIRAGRVVVDVVDVPVLIDHFAVLRELVEQLLGYFKQWRPMNAARRGMAQLVEKVQTRKRIVEALDAVFSLYLLLWHNFWT